MKSLAILCEKRYYHYKKKQKANAFYDNIKKNESIHNHKLNRKDKPSWI